eukprot:6478837-Amphidinium_carterae.2
MWHKHKRPTQLKAQVRPQGALKCQAHWHWLSQLRIAWTGADLVEVCTDDKGTCTTSTQLDNQ